MATHRPILSTDEIYHVFNRTINKELVFGSNNNLEKVLDIVNYYRFDQLMRFSKFKVMPINTQTDYVRYITNKAPLVEIFVFAFMPNHFHFLLKQIQDRGIARFLSNMQNSYAKYYNLKNERDGGLFKNSFKAKRILNNEEFIHVSRYIHLNHVTSKIIEFSELSNYEWASLRCYVNPRLNKFVTLEPLLNYFKKIDNYLAFLKNQVDYQRKLKEIKELLLD